MKEYLKINPQNNMIASKNADMRRLPNKNPMNFWYPKIDK